MKGPGITLERLARLEEAAHLARRCREAHRQYVAAFDQAIGKPGAIHRLWQATKAIERQLDDVLTWLELDDAKGARPMMLREADIAKICHEANRAYCETLGDHTLVPWRETPTWQQEFILSGVRFRLNNPDAPISANHENWIKDRLAAGWRYGAVKDAQLKTHPQLVPWEELPPEQRHKDRLFSAIVLSFLEREVPA